MSTAAQEARKPAFDLPFGLLVGLAICTLLYILMSATLTGLLPYAQLNDAAPVAVALRAHEGLNWLTPFVVFGALAGLTSVVLVLILGQARILLAMSRDGLLPPAWQGPWHLQDAVFRYMGYRLRCSTDGRAVPDWHPRRTRVDRHATRVRDGVRKRVDTALRGRKFRGRSVCRHRGSSASPVRWSAA